MHESLLELRRCVLAVKVDSKWIVGVNLIRLR